jgi:prepilin-type N-terminal cleavage/methylation domain-containing protein
MNARPANDGKRGFTLIEVIITLSIFLLLAAAVFGIFTATLESVAGLQDNQNQSDQAEALGAFLKKSLMDLPPEGNIFSYHRDGAPFKVSGLIWGAGTNLRAIDMQAQANGYYTLRLATYTPPAQATVTPSDDFRQQVLANDASLSWRPLVRDIRTADWRFRAYGIPQWNDQATAQKPVLAEFTMQLAGATSPITDDFWIPPTQSAANPVAAAVAPGVTSGGAP